MHYSPSQLQVFVQIKRPQRKNWYLETIIDLRRVHLLAYCPHTQDRRAGQERNQREAGSKKSWRWRRCSTEPTAEFRRTRRQAYPRRENSSQPPLCVPHIQHEMFKIVSESWDSLRLVDVNSWMVKWCGCGQCYRRFGSTCYLHLQGRPGRWRHTHLQSYGNTVYIRTASSPKKWTNINN